MPESANSENINSKSTNNDLKKELLEFCAEASTRTRYVFIILLVASVLTFIAIHNSKKDSWMDGRLKDLEKSILKSQKAKQVFGGENSIDAWKLASNLKEGKDTISMKLRTELSSDTKKLLDNYDNQTPPGSELIEPLVEDLLKLCDKNIFNSKILQNIELSNEVKKFLSAKNQLSDNDESINSNLNTATNSNSNVNSKSKQRPLNQNSLTDINKKEFLIEYPNNPQDRIQLNLLILRDVYPKYSSATTNYFESNFDEKQQIAMFRPFSENKYYVKLPFFGAAFDINDLGLFSGISLVIVLLLLRFSVSREIKNLKYGFKTAKANNFLKDFYYSLAARQIFTVPHMKDEHRNLWLVQSPKLIILLPFISYSYVVVYDWYSVFKEKVYSFEEVWTILIPEIPFLVLIILLSLKYYERQRHIDEIWERNWEELEYEKSAVVWLDEDLVEEFGTDKLTSKALKEYKKLRDRRTSTDKNEDEE
jgi:hypothetical protein